MWRHVQFIHEILSQLELEIQLNGNVTDLLMSMLTNKYEKQEPPLIFYLLKTNLFLKLVQ